MKCPYCGKEITDEKVCPKCFAEITKPKEVSKDLDKEKKRNGN